MPLTNLIPIMGLVWVIGTWARIFKQARFFQIEEYMNVRYLNWWLNHREHVFPLRSISLFLILTGGLWLFRERSSQILWAIVMIVTIVLTVFPDRDREVKKPLRMTGRVKRLLFGAFVVAGLAFGLSVLSIKSMITDAWLTRVFLVNGAGLAVFLLAPVWLVGGNLLMYPVEALMRQRFINSARDVMKQLNPTVIGITGSYGKTSTKRFVEDILNGRYKAYATPKSYNTLMGICLAINNDLKDDYSTDYFIVEMGAYVQGEIERICQLTPPQIAIVTALGPQHLERFGTVENIVEAKYELVKNLPADGVAVFNWDNPHIRSMMDRNYPQTRIGVSQTVALADAPPEVRFMATDIQESLTGLRFAIHDRQTGQSANYETSVVGIHNVNNILLAVAVAVQQGMTLQEIGMRVRALKPAESRLTQQVTASGITIINDAYSANPEGVVSALRVLGLHTTGRRVLITPGMVELGEVQNAENYKLGVISAQYATDIILVGSKQTQPIYDGLRSVGFDAERLQVVDELRQAMKWIEDHLKAGDTVLFLNDLPDTY